MRLWIKRPSFSIRTPFQFATPNGTIDVIRESCVELKWTWWCGNYFRAACRFLRFGKDHVWQITSTQEAFNGRPDKSPSRHSRLNRREWRSEAQVFYQDSCCRSGVVRNSEKRRILYWRTSWDLRSLWSDVVCSKVIENSRLPILLGFVVVDLWPQD